MAKSKIRIQWLSCLPIIWAINLRKVAAKYICQKKLTDFCPADSQQVHWILSEQRLVWNWQNYCGLGHTGRTYYIFEQVRYQGSARQMESRSVTIWEIGKNQSLKSPRFFSSTACGTSYFLTYAYLHLTANVYLQITIWITKVQRKEKTTIKKCS